MGKVYEEIGSDLETWLLKQPMFFVSTAPLASDGLINCSPKGLDSFRILGPKKVGYLDLHGSGIETVAHLRENGRIVLMFAAMNGPPNIVRLHGVGKAHDLHSARFKELLPEFAPLSHPRSIIEVDLVRIADSCGYGVPKFEFMEQRATLPQYCQN